MHYSAITHGPSGLLRVYVCVYAWVCGSIVNFSVVPFHHFTPHPAVLEELRISISSIIS